MRLPTFLTGLMFAASIHAQEAAPPPAPDAAGLIQLLGSEQFVVRETASKRLIEKGLAILPELKKAAHSRDVETRWRAAAIFAKVCANGRDRLRRQLLQQEQSEDYIAALRELTAMDDETRALIRVGLTADRQPILLFDAATYAQGARLPTLEYLIDINSSKSYESIAGIDAAEWSAFKTCFDRRPGALLLRWQSDGAVVVRTLNEMLPNAAPSLNCQMGEEHEEGGVMIDGKNRDESNNDRLPPSGIAIQVGIVLGAAQQKSPGFHPEIPGTSDSM